MNKYDNYLDKCDQYQREYMRMLDIARCYNRGLCTLEELQDRVALVSEAEYQRDLAYINLDNACYCQHNDGCECLVCKTKRQLLTGFYPTGIKVPAINEPFELGALV